MAPEQDFVDVMALADLAVGGQAAALVNGRRILVCRTGQGVFALADLCPHARQRLAGGAIEGAAIRCPHHGACFDIASGRPLNTVTTVPVATFPVRERAGRIEAQVPIFNGGFMPDFSQKAL